MEQIFINIFKHERTANMAWSGVREGQQNGKAFVAIADSGITPEVRQQLFTPFFGTKPNGQGLGLTMIQEILSRHGCEFSLQSLPGQPTQPVIYWS